MKKSFKSIDLDSLKAKYQNIECFFTYYDGDNSSFDFYGNSLDGTEVRIHWVVAQHGSRTFLLVLITP